MYRFISRNNKQNIRNFFRVGFLFFERGKFPLEILNLRARKFSFPKYKKNVL